MNAAFKALSDPTRREILRLLAAREMSAGDLAAHFDMSKPSVSHHFAVLKEADLVRSRREGQRIWYALNTTVAQDLITWLWDLFGPSQTPGCNSENGAAAAVDSADSISNQPDEMPRGVNAMSSTEPTVVGTQVARDHNHIDPPVVASLESLDAEASVTSQWPVASKPMGPQEPRS
jgi:ArsR family transcriptional regulator, arsenate/arsenite/antimonite-responsive transcriptional repressor